MNDALIALIKAFTFTAREVLRKEAGRQLENLYGWLPDGRFADTRHYRAILELDEARQTRRRLEQYATDEKASGVRGENARRKLIRETAFTWLNRLVAFRLMEERKLLKQTIAGLEKSGGFIYWLAADANKNTRAIYQQGRLPRNALGEGPCEAAYRQFLLWQCGELARDVSLLFDPMTLPSALCPGPDVLKQLVDEMKAEGLIDAWKPGNEETIGWVYQAFNEDELQAAFAGAREQGKKFKAEDIPAVTQLFTARWVVRFLIENTVGRLWIEMHPDSRLKNSLAYFVPAENPPSRPMKLAREVTFLDPCCGSMHFGLVAFDIFVEMYREELERAGQAGWPETPSVASADEIPASIIGKNIFGIDLEFRAVQLSALTLFLRARTLNARCKFSDRNLACANIEKITGGRLEEFINQSELSHPVHERILRALAARLRDSDNLGSLLRLEKDLESLIAEERRKAQTARKFSSALPGSNIEQSGSRHSEEQFFGILSEEVMRHLDRFVQACRTAGRDPGHFVSEAAKGVRFMRVIAQRYDAVATNPPYLSARKMNKRLAALMADEYPEARSDLYAAFIVRCEELLNESGLMGMFTMHSFMFIGRYENLRAGLRRRIAVQTLVHFGGGVFAVGNPGTLQTVAFVLRREPDERRREEKESVYFRLVKEPDSESKRRAFENALARLHDTRNQAPFFRCTQKDFDAVPGKPWIYWISPGISALFKQCRLLGELGTAINGCFTCDNRRFLRYWWEIGHENLYPAGRNDRRNAKWFPYQKGGGFRRWYGKNDYVVNYGMNGKEIRARREEGGQSKSLPGEGFYFHEGITYSYLTSGSFSARWCSGNGVFDIAGSSIFSGFHFEILAILNSKLAGYLLKLINPTVNYQVGDLRRLPICPTPNAVLSGLSQDAVNLANLECREIETSLDFIKPPENLPAYRERMAAMDKIEKKIDQEVARAYGLGKKDMDTVEQELFSPAFTNSSDEVENDAADEDQSSRTDRFRASRWISYAFGTVLGRYETGAPNGLGSGEFSSDIAAAIREHIDPGGIMTSDTDHPLDIAKRSLACLELMLGQNEVHDAVCTATGAKGDLEKLLRSYIDRHFWKYHYRLYRKRPIYWPLQSPKKKFTVWVFHEKFTKDTLFKVRSGFADSKIRRLESRIDDLRKRASLCENREKRSAEKEASRLMDVLDDVQEFAMRLDRITRRGYVPHIDDGVRINAAPLWELLPSWPDTKKAWGELESGRCDWARQAMEYWPDRVAEKCRTTKSLAIAHGLSR